jgi:hypothetical protein
MNSQTFGNAHEPASRGALGFLFAVVELDLLEPAAVLLQALRLLYPFGMSARLDGGAADAPEARSYGGVK